MPAHKKRTEELSRPRERQGKSATTADITQGELGPSVVPHAGQDWHPIAKRLYGSLRGSGTAAFFEQPDWETAWWACHRISEFEKLPPAQQTAQKLAEVRGMWLAVMPTEVERRKARIELQKHVEHVEDAEIVAIRSRAKQAFELLSGDDEDDEDD